MTAKLDGTNGLLQQYDFQTPTTGFSYTFAAGVNVLVMNPAGTLATGTVTMPAAPVDGMTITVESTQQITALTVQGNTGQSLVNGTQTLRPNQPYSWVYRLSNTTWYPFAGATNSQIVSGVSQATNTSAATYDFTGIPSWVKRVTVMFNGVSTNGISPVCALVGTSSGIVSTGYSAGGMRSFVTANDSVGVQTVRFLVDAAGQDAGATRHGHMVLTNLSGNVWVQSSITSRSDGNASSNCGGSITLSATLDRLRLTTINGTDTFDAGSINILYE